MQKGESSFREKLDPYEYNFEGGSFNSFVFQTTNKSIYEVKFKPSPYLFGEDVVFSSLIYEFVLAVLKKGNKSKNPSKRIKETLVSILLDFYAKNNNNICLYICDSSDGKQMAREKLFDKWYNQYKLLGFIKTGEIITDADGVEYPIAMLFKLTNPYRGQIIEDFGNLIADNNKK